MVALEFHFHYTLHKNGGTWVSLSFSYFGLKTVIKFDTVQPVQNWVFFLFTVEVYKCEYIVLNCGQCVTLDAKYGCSWCANRRQCSLQEDCTEGLWISANDTCPNPQIHSVCWHITSILSSNYLLKNMWLIMRLSFWMCLLTMHNCTWNPKFSLCRGNKIKAHRIVWVSLM